MSSHNTIKFLSRLKKNCTHATVELTKRCNALCDYCFVAQNASEDLTKEQVFYIFDKLSEAGITSLTLTGGEPFIRKDMSEILTYLTTKDFWFIFIFSNGILITEKQIDFISNHTQFFSGIQFSIFSHDPAIHDSYVGVQGALQKIISTAKRLKEAGVQITLAYNILDFNYKDFQKTIDFFTSYGFYIRWCTNKIIFERPSGERTQNTKRLKKVTSFDFFCDFIPQLNLDYAEEKKKWHTDSSNNDDTKKRISCNGILSSVNIDSTGTITPCNSFRNLKIGTIFDQKPLAEILKGSKELQNIRSLRLSDMKKCCDCKFRKFCIICLGNNHTETGRCDIPSQQNCAYAKAYEQVILKQ